MNTVSILSYGIGNIKSVERAFHAIGTQPKLISTASEIYSADRLVLPGVGAFSACSNALRSQNLWHSILDFFKLERPFLGICVGMQLLFEYSEEFGTYRGFGLIPGHVSLLPIQKNRKIPFVGWSKSNFIYKNSFFGNDFSKQYYFIHSYAGICRDNTNLLSYHEYGEEKITSSVYKNNIIGTQFHPEKSGYAGLNFLKKFVEI